jgi:hypothetical protein
LWKAFAWWPHHFTSILSVPDEGYSRNASCPLNLISTFFFINPATFYWSACTKPWMRTIMYLCDRGFDIVSFYDFSIRFWNCSSVSYFAIRFWNCSSVSYFAIRFWNCSVSVVFFVFHFITGPRWASVYLMSWFDVAFSWIVV